MNSEMEAIDKYESKLVVYRESLRGAMEEAAKDNKEISPEYKDFARYLRLSLLRQQEILSDEGYKELVELTQKNEMASEIESLRTDALNRNNKGFVPKTQSNNTTATMEAMRIMDTYHPNVPTIDFEAIRRAEEEQRLQVQNNSNIEEPQSLEEGGKSR